eukprot:TRINITY_DN74896_c0_g1_i1.p1 TRINITY_DN74896_c0_g1~~TRINITY_DN74896_c0_g1_i1.p1  ORF type:complete len:1030 (+),score=143.36 TRINITY_DN74896_c0_g1_i1:207-3092(+)
MAFSEDQTSDKLLAALHFLAHKSPALHKKADRVMARFKAEAEKQFRAVHKDFQMEMWKPAYCWMMLDDELLYGAEGIVVGHSHHPPSPPMLAVQFRAGIFNFPKPTTSVKAVPPPQKVAGWNVGSTIYHCAPGKPPTEATVLGPPSAGSGVTIRARKGEVLVVDASELSAEAKQISPNDALEAAVLSLRSAKGVASMLEALSRLTDLTRAAQVPDSWCRTHIMRLRAAGSHRGAKLSSTDAELHEDLNRFSRASELALQCEFKVRASLTSPLPSEVAVKGGKLLLHRTSLFKDWLQSQLDKERIHVLLVRAEWEPPSIAHPLLRRAMGVALHSLETFADPEAMLEVYRFGTRMHGAQRALIQPLIAESLLHLTHFASNEDNSMHRWRPLIQALTKLGHPDLLASSTAEIIKTANASRQMLEECRQNVSAVSASLLRSQSGNSNLAMVLREEQWNITIATIENDVELRLLELFFRRCLVSDSKSGATGLRNAAKEIVLLFRECNKIICRLAELAETLKLGTTSQWKTQAQSYERLSVSAKKLVSASSKSIEDFFAAIPRSLSQVCCCSCGLQSLELANSSDCTLKGLCNHIDFPPAACLPIDPAHDNTDENAMSQYYYDSEGPFRHWALIVEVQDVLQPCTIMGKTRYGECVRVEISGALQAMDLAPRRTMLCLYAKLSAAVDGPPFQLGACVELEACSADSVFVFDVDLQNLLKESDAIIKSTAAKQRCNLQGLPELLQIDFRKFTRALDRSSVLPSCRQAEDAPSTDASCVAQDTVDEDVSANTRQQATDVHSDHHQSLSPIMTHASTSAQGSLTACDSSVVDSKSKQRNLHTRPGRALAEKTGHIRICPSQIFFTHDSIKACFRDGRPIAETLAALRSGQITVNVIPTLQVSWAAESSWSPRWWTFTGNRRLWVFRQLQEIGILVDVIVAVTEERVPRFRLTSKNGGKSVRVRGVRYET